jgi:hypothetical protein
VALDDDAHAARPRRARRALCALVVAAGILLPSAPADAAPRARTEAAPIAPTWLTAALEAGLRKRAVPAGLTPPLSEARRSLPVIYRSPRCHLGIPETTQGTCRYGDPRGRRTVVLFGDSHAAHWFPALDRKARGQHWRLVSLTKTSCAAPHLTVYLRKLGRNYTECNTWRRYVYRRLAALRPDLVLMASARTYYDGPRRSAGFDRKWAHGTASTVRRLRATGAAVVLLTDNPYAGNVIACLTRHRTDARQCVRSRVGSVMYPDQLRRETEAGTAAGATAVDPTPWFCTSHCPVIVGRTLVHRDSGHLTVPYASWLSRVLGPILVEAMS